MQPEKNNKELKAYIMAVNMGYGHQRAAYPFLADAVTPAEWKLEKPAIILVDNYPGIPLSDRLLWKYIRKTYEIFSRTYMLPLVGKYIYRLLDYVEYIPPLYPFRDLSTPMFQTRSLYWTIRRGHGKHLIKILNKNPLPLFTSYFVTAFFAEEHGYKGDIYCLCTDTDISRAWAPLDPKNSRIIYCAPNDRVKDRLKLYGVSPDKIFVTGFPIPKEITGNDEHMSVLKAALARRLGNLDPRGAYTKKHAALIEEQLGKEHPLIDAKSPLTITFAVGGAGAQYKIGIALLNSLSKQLLDGSVRLNLVAGSSARVYKKYFQAIKRIDGIDHASIEILYHPNVGEYMSLFNKALIGTDILWTKPSELSFYAGVGLPIVIAPPLGAQEEFNQEWLHVNGAGMEQPNPKYADEWLKDMLNEGMFAETAMNGFINIPKRGVFHIEHLLSKKA